jgi:alcohol dehydrogenase class IV
MISLPPYCSLADATRRLANPAVWCTPSAARRLAEWTGWSVSTEPPPLERTDWLVAAGGGTLLDRAKLLRCDNPHVKLAALPTLWGSGAEASPIAVATAEGKKVVHVSPTLVPDLVIIEPRFADSLPAVLKTQACGDAWSHALEGFLSPLGTDDTRADMAGVIGRMCGTPSDDAAEWLKLSALACAGQSRTSVGLTHGIAHSLEVPLSWGHARLCSLFLLPVMTFNRSASPKWPLLSANGVNEQAVWQSIRSLFDPADYATALPFLRERWPTILRDPCSRTNSALVRPGDVAFFESFVP